MIGINQIILTPCILLHTSFSIALYTTTTINIILVLLSLKIKNKKVEKRQGKNILLTTLMCILIGMQLVLTTITYKENADDSFYVSLSTCSIDSDSIYKEEPSMGYESDKGLLTITEQMPSWELQIGIWSKLSGINPAILCHSVLPMIILFMAYLAFYYFARVFFDDKNSKILLIILSVIFLITGFSTRFRPGYLLTRTWQGKTIILNIGITMILASLIRLDKETKKSELILLAISNLFSIALSSTAIFIIPFTYLAFGILKLMKWKWKDIIHLIISFIPVIIYVTIYLVLNSNAEVAFDVPREDVSIVDSLKYYQNIIYLIYYVIATIIIMFIGTKSAKRYFCYVQLINLITIWNPLFSNIIAKYFTSSATFWRILWLIPIEFAIAYCITRTLEKTENKKIKILVIIISGVILVIPGKSTYSFELTENLENIPQYIINHTNYILNESKDDNEIVVLATPEPYHNATMRQLSSKIKLIYSRGFYIGKIKIEDEMEERTYLNQLYYEDYRYSIEEFNKIVEKQEVDWMIINNGNINLINYVEQSCLKKECEIDGFTLYKK